MGGTVDFQICSAAVRLQAPIFTTDRDFEQFSAVLPIRLYDLRARGVSD
jgi:predicted nucleic acid-binding protein